MRKKLQVFISSTYNDLIEERQAAVEAILNAGHMPAGMELFTAGNASQLETVKRWIDESDVYLLILGGKYGSIEPISGKSYTQVEYEYAISKMPFFSIVISDLALEQKVKIAGTKALEQDNYDKYKDFRENVTGKICRFFDDIKDIKISIHETLAYFEKRFTFTGWVSGKDIPDFEGLLLENRKLQNENSKIKSELEKIRLKNNSNKTNEDEMAKLANILVSTKIIIPSKVTGNDRFDSTLLDIFRVYADYFAIGVSNQIGSSEYTNYLFHDIAPKLLMHNLVTKVKVSGVKWQRIETSKYGYQFLSFIENKKLQSKSKSSK